MKPDHLPGAAARLSRSRRALAQPRFLAASMALAVAGCAYLATAQTGSAPVEMRPPSASTSSEKPASLEDLPGLIEAYGRSRQQATSGKANRLAAVGNGQSGYNLIESDLTPSTKSDEREPAYAPGGGSIAFVSNGVDANKDGRMDDAVNDEGKFHIWVMNSDGKNQRQITGLTTADKNRNQGHPSWAPTGSELVYVDGEDAATELYIVRPFAGGISPNSQVALPERITTIPGNKKSPAWSPTGLSIVFASDAKLGQDTAGVAGQYDLYSIPPEGSDGTGTSVQRLTGGSLDMLGNTTDDLNPSFSVMNPNILYFSSNRGLVGGTVQKLDAGRRIWDVNFSTRALTQVSDPQRRARGQAADTDDYPTASIATNSGAVRERVAFQSNSLIDASDTTQDLNIWSFERSTSVVAPYVETAPRVFVSNYTGNGVFNENPLTDAPGAGYQNLGAVGAPEGVAVSGQYVYVAASTPGRVIRYVQNSGNQDNVAFNVPDNTIPKASGLITDGQYVYVGSGIGATNKVAIYRINAGNGANEGRAPGSAVFSGGEPTAEVPSNGTEGLTFSPNREFIYVSSYSDDRILVYNRGSGDYVKTFTKGDTATGNPLDGPTGLTFGPDLNEDGFPDLYVCSSNSDDVLAFMGPNPNDPDANVNGGSSPPGTFITTVVSDDDGTVTNLNAPEGIQIIPRKDNPSLVYLYVSNYHDVDKEGATGSGNDINRYRIDISAIDPTDSKTQTATPEGRNGSAENATFITLEPNPQGPVGIGYFDFNTLARESLATASGTPQPTATPRPQSNAVEGNRQALVITNILSSPDNYAASLLQVEGDVVGEDKAADREATFSRSNATDQIAVRIAFASTRRYAPNPASNAKDAQGNKPGPSNPYGSNGDGGTHDIWGTVTQDTTPPALIPQGTGNQLYPVLAPGIQAPEKDAPRTFDEGLRPGGRLKIAVVLSDLESGIVNGGVSATISQAGKEQFVSQNERINERIRVNLRRERSAPAIAGIGLSVYDDGPASADGHERQADAVKGDGIYYCEGVTNAPNITGDFYITISTSDQRGNNFTYDNIWGFTTENFNRPQDPTNQRNLLVSDYAAGQQFPAQTGDSRFGNMYPVESYYLTNEGGQGITDDGKIVGTSSATTFANVDVWRTLCRGPITQGTLDAYGPNKTPQIDPAETGVEASKAFTERTRLVNVSTAYVIWAAPYAGTAFVGPGTITDAVVQSRLKSFLNKGGRLFVSGRDVAFALSNAGKVNNDFLNNELGAKLAGEAVTDELKAISLNNSASFVQYPREYDAKYYDLQLPYHYTQNGDENYGDAALTQNQYGGEEKGPDFRNSVAGTRVDTITPQPGDGTFLTTAYTLGAGGPVVGQRILKERSADVRSRAVFFSFGFEAVNRRYRVPTDGFPIGALDMRRNIAGNLSQYFKTGSISGRVTNKLGEGIPNFLLTVDGPGGRYLVRTDADGGYNIIGLEQGGYTVDIAWLSETGDRLVTRTTPGATTSPAGFYSATPQNVPVNGGIPTQNVDFGLLSDEPGSLNGRVVSSKGTPNDLTDDDVLDDKVVGMPVLVRSLVNVGTTGNGGRFAQIVQTDRTGRFTFSQVPANIDLQVVFNPTEADIPEESGLRATYSGPSTKVGRRVIPDARRADDLQVPVGDTFTANDPDPKKYPNPETGPVANGPDADVAADSGVPIVVPEGPSVRGVLTLNGTPVSGIVELLDSKGAPLTPARTKNTAIDGLFTFSDVAPGTYRLRGTANTSDGIVATKDVADVDVVQGADSVVNIPIVISKISGKVTLNNLPAEGAKVQLLTNAGNVFSPSRTATTDAEGKYTLLNVPNGKYRVRATSGKTSGTVEVTVTDKDVTADDIVLLNQQVSGVVLLRTDGETAKPQAGILVELLTPQSTPLSPAVTTTTDSSGNYAFDEVGAGKYKIRASYKGDTDISGEFTVAAGQATRGPSLTLDLQTLQVKVIDTNKKIVVGAAVSIRLTTETRSLQSGVTNSSGLFTFKELPAGKFTVTATKTNLGATAEVKITSGQKAPQLVLTLSGDITGKSNPTAFNVPNKIYLISLPYELTNSPSSSNVSETVGKIKPATIKVKEAFTVKPINDDGSRNFEIQSFDPITRKYVQLNNDSVLVRGVGYLLKAGKKGTAIKFPAQDSRLKALTDPNFEKMFTVTLHRNASVFNDPMNGRNLIGFGFNPDKFKTVLWNDAQVIHPNGQVAESIRAAVDKGWLQNQFTTLDSTVPGDTPKTVTATQLKPFGGYYAQTNVDGLKIVLRKPAR